LLTRLRGRVRKGCLFCLCMFEEANILSMLVTLAGRRNAAL
jgi:hypothetical protein